MVLESLLFDLPEPCFLSFRELTGLLPHARKSGDLCTAVHRENDYKGGFSRIPDSRLPSATRASPAPVAAWPDFRRWGEGRRRTRL